MWHAASCVALSRGTALCTIPHQLNWALTVELGLLERLDLADVDVLHRVDALDGLEDLPGDVLGDAGKARSAPSRHTSENNIFPHQDTGDAAQGVSAGITNVHTSEEKQDKGEIAQQWVSL